MGGFIRCLSFCPVGIHAHRQPRRQDRRPLCLSQTQTRRGATPNLSGPPSSVVPFCPLWTPNCKVLRAHRILAPVFPRGSPSFHLSLAPPGPSEVPKTPSFALPTGAPPCPRQVTPPASFAQAQGARPPPPLLRAEGRGACCPRRPWLHGSSGASKPAALSLFRGPGEELGFWPGRRVRSRAPPGWGTDCGNGGPGGRGSWRLTGRGSWAVALETVVRETATGANVGLGAPSLRRNKNPFPTPQREPPPPRSAQAQVLPAQPLASEKDPRTPPHCVHAEAGLLRRRGLRPGALCRGFAPRTVRVAGGV
jgi:hypothetical protein